MGLPGLPPVGEGAPEIRKSASTGLLPAATASVSSAKSMRFMTTTRLANESPFDGRFRESADSMAIFKSMKNTMQQTRVPSFNFGEPALTLSHPCRIMPKQTNRLPAMREPIPTPAFDTENRMAQRDILEADYDGIGKQRDFVKTIKLKLSRSSLSLGASNNFVAWKKRNEYASAPEKYTSSVPVPAMKNSGPMWFNATERTYETEGNLIHAKRKGLPPADNVSAQEILALKLLHQTPQWSISHERDEAWEKSHPVKFDKKVFTIPNHEGAVLPPLSLDDMLRSNQKPYVLPPKSAFASFDKLNDSIYEVCRTVGRKATLDMSTI